MKEVKFSVSAKTARLIGRENIADVDGALIELIKNAYDADASCVLVRLEIPFPDVPEKLEMAFANKILGKEDFNKISKFYIIGKDCLVKRYNLSDGENSELQNILFSYNKIVIAENGHGMTSDVVETTWMHIGTSDKEYHSVSPKGRIKTGAKGIGRFALDKLSKYSVMYTKSVLEESVLQWSMDWEQFANAKLIEDVKGQIISLSDSYLYLVKSEFPEYEKMIEQHEWETGTMLVLSPTREVWTQRLFKKVNTNLNSINPIGTVDRFDIAIQNDYYTEFNYHSKDVKIDKEDYDYRLQINYDGREILELKLLRNEVNLSLRKVKIEKYSKSVVKDINEFWQREKLQNTGYRREDYDKEIIRDINVKTVLNKDSLERIQQVGPFQAEMYFLRNANSSDAPLMKRITVSKRKELLNSFSGIKIYRDDFKVRPYGDEGALYDWLDLGGRAQKSPAGPSHLQGRWRVQPYQMIGWVKIGRDSNPMLTDMANREGLALTETYYIFVNLLQVAIDAFEYDRQYIYREYAKWVKEVEDTLGDHTERVKDAAEKRAKQKEKKQENSQREEEEKRSFTEEDFLDTVQKLVEESEQDLHSKQMMQVLSSSGIILNTFFHEFNAINTQFHVQASQIRSRINYILNGEEYKGLPAYNPYTRIDVLEKNDRVIAAFLDVVMEGLKKEGLQKREMSFHRELLNILNKWQLMLEDRYISINPKIFEDNNAGNRVIMAVVDLYIIINNFLLNSAWFLEECHNEKREIWFELTEKENDLCFLMANNGPALDAKYMGNPDKIFEIGESSKHNGGTGLGLWVVKETVERNNGSIRVLDQEEGFALEIVFKGMVKKDVSNRNN